MKRSCQRHAAVLAMPAMRMIAFLPSPVSCPQDDSVPPDMLLGRIPVRDHRLKAMAGSGRDGEGYSGAHADPWHVPFGMGIPQDSSVRWEPLDGKKVRMPSNIYKS